MSKTPSTQPSRVGGRAPARGAVNDLDAGRLQARPLGDSGGLPYSTLCPPTKVRLLEGLWRGGAITRSQLKRFLREWPLEKEWWSSPYLRVREHTRAFIGEGTRAFPTPSPLAAVASSPTSKTRKEANHV